MDGHQYTANFEAPNGQPVLTAYPDPITKSAPWTIGIGHTGPDVREGTIWPADRCMVTFYSDYAIAQATASHLIGTYTWATLCDPRQAVLVDMAFNMGGSGLSQFQDMLSAIRKSDWHGARAELLNSTYAHELPKRAIANASTLFTGEWPIAA